MTSGLFVLKSMLYLNSKKSQQIQNSIVTRNQMQKPVFISVFDFNIIEIQIENKVG